MIVERELDTLLAFDALIEQPENISKRFEYLHGEIIEVPSNPHSSEIAMQIGWLLGNWVYPRKLGRITGEQGGYIVAGARLAPDVAFVSFETQPELARRGYNPVAPDLAAEVMSPTDDEEQLQKKLLLYAAANVLTWVVREPTRTVDVHEPGKPMRTLGIGDTLHGGDVLPGFTLPVRAIFP
jgi:Uma2 family endonuclease